MTPAVNKALGELHEALLHSPLKSMAGHWVLILMRVEKLERLLRETP